MASLESDHDGRTPAGSDGAPALLDVDGVRKIYNGDRKHESTEAIHDLTFRQTEGEFLVIVGPSGCGKSTLLRCLSGLMQPTEGSVTFRGKPVTDVPDGLSVVFQQYERSLFPWMRVDENVEVGIEKIAKRERADRVAEALEHVGLSDSARKYPWQLSGGMQQRVSIARSIAARPDMILMDEPFASVDAQTRVSLESLTLSLWKEYGWTALLVTHDIDEAVFMADRVLVLSHRPSRIVADITIDLPRERDQLETRALPEFQAYRRQIVELIRQQKVGG